MNKNLRNIFDFNKTSNSHFLRHPQRKHEVRNQQKFFSFGRTLAQPFSP